CELSLEGIDVRAERCDPVRVEGLREEPSLFVAHVGGREMDAGRQGRHPVLPRASRQRAGIPTAVTPPGMARVSTAPAPRVAQDPMVRPGRTTAPRPTWAPSPTRTAPPRATRGET